MSQITSLDLDAQLRPRRTPLLTTASVALRTATQGQFQSIDASTPILADQGGGSHTLLVRCRPASVMGAMDAPSLVTVRVRSTAVITKPAAAAAGTLVSAVLDADTHDLVAVVLPDTGTGAVSVAVVLDAADAACQVTLQHRHVAAAAAIAIA